MDLFGLDVLATTPCGEAIFVLFFSGGQLGLAVNFNRNEQKEDEEEKEKVSNTRHGNYIVPPSLSPHSSAFRLRGISSR